MLSFYGLPEHIRIFASLFGAATVAIHTFALVYRFRCHMTEVKSTAKNALEILLLLCLIILAMIPSSLNFYLRDGMFPESTFALTGLAFWILYLSALTFFMVRGLFAIKSCRDSLKNRITATSIKEAIDSLNSGLLFCEKTGGIVLQNKRMLRLMIGLLGKVTGNGLQFYEMLEASPLREDIEDNLVFRLEDGKVWQFAKTKIKVGQTIYFQITATDVTLRWQLIDELEEQNSLSKKRSDELRYLLNNLFQIRYRQERLQLRTSLHDILGQQITLFQRKLQGDELPTSKDIEELIACLDIKQYGDEGKNSTNPIGEVVSAFASIGVEIQVSGPGIEADIVKKTFAYVLRESASNAVRHGFATKVEAEFEKSRDLYIFSVWNNGVPPPEYFAYGTGLSGMEYRLNELGGRLELQFIPHYKVLASIPQKGA